MISLLINLDFSKEAKLSKLLIIDVICLVCYYYKSPTLYILDNFIFGFYIDFFIIKVICNIKRST